MRRALLAALCVALSTGLLAASEPVRGVSGDLWADVILGKPDFTEITPNEVVPWKIFNPGGVLVDRSVSPGRLYVWDSGNSRILGIDLATCYAQATPCPAQIVLGQPSGFDHSACNGDSGFQRYPLRAAAGADTLCGIPEVTLSPLEWKSFVTMASDTQGNLYVPDAFNDRVLKYVSPFTTDRTADEVWGQSDFSGNQCNRGGPPTASTLCFTTGTFSSGGVALDASGNLWVADRGNNRVLRFSRNPTTGVIPKTADLVLGQADFVSNGAGSALSRMQSPAAVRFGPDGRLYVADSENHRVLIFTPGPSFVTGMSASSLFSWPFAAPYGLESDPAGAGLWVTDSANNMLLLWNWNGTTVLKVLGKDTFQPDGNCMNWGSVANLCNFGGGVGIDTAGNVLPSVFTWNQDVPRFAAPIPAPQAGVVIQPDKRLFHPPDGYNLRGGKGLRSGSGVAIYGDQLLVGDGGRVVFWNGLDSLTNGKPFDGFVGDPNFSYTPTCCGYLKTDSADRLWVHDYGLGVHVYGLPLTSASSPIATRFWPGWILPVLGGGSLTLNRIDGIVPSPAGDFLWVSDAFNNRVLRIRNPLASPVVDVILGQTGYAGTQCNRGLVPPPGTGTGLVATADMICHPGALSLDRQGNLFVSDHGPEVEGNWRLLRFEASLFPPGIAAPLFAVPATKIFPYVNAQPGITFEPAFDSQNRMVVGYNPYLGGRFVGVYDDPAGPSTNPDRYLNDFFSWPSGIAFDGNDNLYVGDNNRGRLLVYRGSQACKADPAGMLVDPSANGGLSDGNGVLEPGETVKVQPSWKNLSADALLLTGTASAFTGPAGPSYTLADSASDYGSIAAGATNDCATATGNCFEMGLSSPLPRPATHWDATFTETLSDGDPPKLRKLHVGQSFTDVPKNHVFYPFVERILHSGVTTGCTATAYCPEDNVFRLQMAVFVARSQAGGDAQIPVSGSAQGNPYNCVPGGQSQFTDVAPDNAFCRHVHYIFSTGVTTGCITTPPRQYCPADNVTRGQMALFIARAVAGSDAAVPVTYGPDPVTGRSYSCNPEGSPNLFFTDIQTSDVFCRHTHYLWAKNVISGFPDGTYGPSLFVTRGAMSKFLANGFHLKLY